MGTFLKCNNCGQIIYDPETKEQDAVCDCIADDGEDHLTDLYGCTIDISEITDDDDLREWCEEHNFAKHRVELVDVKSGLVWVKNCPYAIRHSDIW